ncbi:unnamed protein product [Sphagnum troendelagicum]|uniref:Secreted protein n=1 Tax=Sphagnum troendelagicum TaxID=128251 RepID=A0ABP0UAW0_9BRYO
MCLFSLRSRLVHAGSFSRTASSCSQQTTKLTTAPSSSSSVAGNRKREGNAYASSAYSSAALKQQRRRPLPRRGQVKAAIFASCLHTLVSIFDGARSAANRHLHFRRS